MNFSTYKFDHETGVFTFPDGVRYTLREALHISRTAATMEDVEAIHKLKSAFDGTVLDGTERNDQPNQTRFDKLRDQAREMARRNIRYLSNAKKGKKVKNGTPRTDSEAQTCLFFDR